MAQAPIIQCTGDPYNTAICPQAFRYADLKNNNLCILDSPAQELSD